MEQEGISISYKVAACATFVLFIVFKILTLLKERVDKINAAMTVEDENA
jgi:hypothetical protein